MSGAIETDVLIVGLGPAGASAAASVAHAGARVIALDRKAVAGVPVQCAEFVPLPLGGEAAIAASECQKISAMLTAVEDDAPDLAQNFRGQMIDRARFDAGLVARAQKAGADCRFATALAALSSDGIAILAKGGSIATRVIIGTDGPRSRVGKTIGHVNSELVETRQVTVPLVAAHDATDIFLSAGMPGGYAWLFPKGEVANLGLGVAPQHRKLLKPLLESLRQRLIREGRIGDRVFGHTGGPIPVGGMIEPFAALGERLVLLAGDAAGLVNPITGAGIPAAVISGRMAGEAALSWLAGNENSGANYAEELDDYFGVALSRALIRRRELLAKFDNGAVPSKADLRSSWIAYPQYWAV
jgi:digeranylgeranylglycerophospholipid reductase